MTETPTEAAARAVAPLMRTILDNEPGLRASYELEPGTIVKAAGDWFAVQRVTEAGDLVLEREKGGPLFYKVTAGERFTWHEGAF